MPPVPLDRAFVASAAPRAFTAAQPPSEHGRSFTVYFVSRAFRALPDLPSLQE